MASSLMVFAAILTAIQGVVVIAIGSGTDAAEPQTYYVNAGIFASVTGGPLPQSLILFLLVATAVFSGLWLRVAAACRNGSSAGRVWATVFFGLSVLGLTNLSRASVPTVDTVLTLFINGIGLIVLILLWSHQASPFFRRERPQPRR